MFSGLLLPGNVRHWQEMRDSDRSVSGRGEQSGYVRSSHPPCQAVVLRADGRTCDRSFLASLFPHVVPLRLRARPLERKNGAPVSEVGIHMASKPHLSLCAPYLGKLVRKPGCSLLWVPARDSNYANPCPAPSLNQNKNPGPASLAGSLQPFWTCLRGLPCSPPTPEL